MSVLLAQLCGADTCLCGPCDEALCGSAGVCPGKMYVYMYVRSQDAMQVICMYANVCVLAECDATQPPIKPRKKRTEKRGN